MIRLLLMSFSGAILGALLKINGNPNADCILGAAILIQFISVVGLVSRWSSYRTRSEVN